MTTQTTQSHTDEVANLTDNIMRLMGGRNLQVCLNSFALSVISLAGDVPKEGRAYISAQIKLLAETVAEIDDESPQVDAFAVEPATQTAATY